MARKWNKFEEACTISNKGGNLKAKTIENQRKRTKPSFYWVMMQLWIISQNVKGLNDLASIQKFWLYYKEQTFSLDILLLQEHELCGEKIKNLRPKLWRRSSCWFIEMANGYVHKKDIAGKGGVCTPIVEKLATIVGKNGILMENTVRWVILKGLLGSPPWCGKHLCTQHS